MPCLVESVFVTVRTGLFKLTVYSLDTLFELFPTTSAAVTASFQFPVALGQVVVYVPSLFFFRAAPLLFHFAVTFPTPEPPSVTENVSVT